MVRRHWQNLAWAITCPSLFHEPWIIDWPLNSELLSDLQARLRHDPDDLQRQLGQPVARRLGHYFEQLWHYYWLHDPDTEVLAHSLQLIEAGHTLGEVDFVLSHQGKVYHIELACKFYLASAGQWLGPNARDSWQRKRQQLLTKQLQHLRQPLGIKILKQQGLPAITTSLAICKGRLFDDQHWLSASQVATLPEGHYQVLQRDQWLAPVSDFPHRQGDLNQLSIERPVCIALGKDNYESDRFFIVPDHWPQPGADH